MRTLFLTILASLSATSLWFLIRAHNIRTRFLMEPVRNRSSVTHLSYLCTYGYWNLPGSRVQEHFSEQ